VARRFKPGGGAPGYGMVGINLGDSLRRQLERVTSRQGISLTDYVRSVVEREISRESFWKFQALRYMTQALLLALSTEFVEKGLGFASPRSKTLRSELRQLIELVEVKAQEEFERNLPPEEKSVYEERKAFRRAMPNEPHWYFEIPEVEQILRRLGSISTTKLSE
jgi:hypothetical protein